jgi:hypothetical protein
VQARPGCLKEAVRPRIALESGAFGRSGHEYKLLPEAVIGSNSLKKGPKGPYHGQQGGLSDGITQTYASPDTRKFARRGCGRRSARCRIAPQDGTLTVRSTTSISIAIRYVDRDAMACGASLIEYVVGEDGTLGREPTVMSNRRPSRRAQHRLRTNPGFGRATI